MAAPMRERDRRHGEAGDRHVRVGVGDAGEDRVVVEQPIEAADPRPPREDQQHEAERDRQPAPRRSAGVASPGEQRACRR